VTSDPEAFCRSFAQRFESIGLSHVGLSVQSRSAAQLGRHFDAVEIGRGAVGLEWHGTVACLSIRTFMGNDTGPRIDVGDLFTLSLPVADYVCLGRGRIEGLGLVPDIEAINDEARSVALTLMFQTAPIHRAAPGSLCHANRVISCARPIP
ncbi:MAG: hypothetical protein AAF141_16275, partial [Pseudomonadota bacterium]